MRILALDLGLRRIGLALGLRTGAGEDGTVALPLAALIRKNRSQAAEEIKKLIASHEITTLLVGIPLGGASEDEGRARAEHFVGLLDFGGEVIFADESGTSRAASEMAAKTGAKNTSKKSRKDGRLDSLAALVLLREFLKIL